MKVSVTLQEVDGEILMPIPDELLAALQLSVGTDVEVRCENGRLAIQSLQASPNAEKLPASDRDKNSL